MLPISEGDTLTVKTRLNAGERRDLFARLYERGAEGKLYVNLAQSGLALITAYLVDWSLGDDHGKVDIRGLAIGDLESVLKSLDPDSFAEIKTAIETHEERMDAARAEEKKRRDGSTGDAMTSRSPFVVVGGSTGSVS